MDQKKHSQRTPIVQCDMANRFIREWDGFKEPSQYFGVTVMALVQACRGQRKSLEGYKWHYKRDYVIDDS